MNCDALAPYYQTLEYLSFGRRLERSRCNFLREAASARRAIICGGGDGRFLARLLRGNAHVTVDFVDASAKMLEMAERRVAAMGAAFFGRVQFFQRDLRAGCALSGNYDLIVTNFFLDCFTDEELAGIVSSLAKRAVPRAYWVLSEFQLAETQLGRLWTLGVIRGLYAGFRVTTGLRVTRLPDYTAALTRAGFIPRWKVVTLGGLLQSSLWVAAERG
jgi:hypothetical protein